MTTPPTSANEKQHQVRLADVVGRKKLLHLDVHRENLIGLLGLNRSLGDSGSETTGR